MSAYPYEVWKEVEDKLKPALSIIWDHITKNCSGENEYYIDKALSGCDVEHFIVSRVLELKEKWLHKEKLQSEYMEELQTKVYRILGETEGIVEEEELYDQLQEIHTDLCIHNVARKYIPQEVIDSLGDLVDGDK